MGTPRKHPPKNAAETIERLAAQGHAIIGIAKQLGVGRDVFKRWCEEDGSLQEAFELGRETERVQLHSLVVQSAVMNKPANVNAFFILKSRHGYRENEPSQVNVGVAVASNVLVVKDHGNDAEWARKAAEQQAKLIAHAASAAPPQIEIPVAQPASIEAQTVPPPPPPFGPPSWRGNA